MWYSVDENRSIVRTRLDISRQKFSRENIFGLERYLLACVAQEYKQRTRALFLTVHTDQRLQRALHILNPEQLTTVTLHHSQWAVERARATALYFIILNIES